MVAVGRIRTRGSSGPHSGFVLPIPEPGEGTGICGYGEVVSFGKSTRQYLVSELV